MSNQNDNGKAVEEPVIAKKTPAEEPETRTEEPPASEDSADLEDPSAQLSALATDRDRLADEKRELEDRLLRRQAEFDNFRRRAEKERQDFAAYAAMETVGALLPILDDFERALKSVPEELGADNDYVKGIEMIYQRLVETLKRSGLEPIESLGKPFDPNVHHAVDRVPTEDAEDHSVLEEWQRGYNFKGRLLREAMVKVAVKPAQPSETSQEEQ